MKTIILAATNLEISILLKKNGCRFEGQALGFNIYRVSHSGEDICLVESGPGLANAAAAAAVAIERFKPEHIFNIGVCGVYSTDNNLLTRVITGTSAIFAEAGVAAESNFQDMEDIGLPFYSKKGGEDFYNRIDLRDDLVDKTIDRGVFLSLSAVSGTADQAERIKNRFDFRQALLCEDMETAAVALTACRAAVPCTAIRGISNLTGDRNYQNWKLQEAAEAAQQVLLETINREK